MKKFPIIVLALITFLNILFLHYRSNKIIKRYEKVHLTNVNKQADKQIDKNIHKKDLTNIEKTEKNLTQIPTFNFPSKALTIIIDDIGESLNSAKDIWNINDNITLSVIPFLKKSVEVSKYAKENNLSVMLHMPMEPQKKLKNYNHFLVSFKGDDYFFNVLYDDLRAIPFYLGINNHMGSKITCNKHYMEKLFTFLDKSNLFFIDSRTYKESVAADIALEHHIKTGVRDVFIDNVESISYILKQLKYAEKLVNTNSYAIAIGHPHKVTIEALRIFLSSSRIPVIRAETGLVIFKEFEKKHIKEKHDSSFYRYRD